MSCPLPAVVSWRAAPEVRRLPAPVAGDPDEDRGDRGQ